MGLTAAKQRQLVQGLTGIASKVYEVIPIQGTMTPQNIVREVMAKGGNLALGQAHGCLNSLCESGLVKEVGKHTYQRVPVKPAVELVPPTTPPPEAEMPTEQIVAQTPFEVLSTLSHQLRQTAITLNSLADGIDSATLEAESLIDKARSETTKLRQLKALLSSIDD